MAADGAPPPLMLAKVYGASGPVNLADYWLSEKLDGVRGYWDGHHLISRGGAAIAAPAWFTAGWPDTPLDGELWAGRGRFELASGTVRAEQPDEAAWKQMRYMVFDMPAEPGPFGARLQRLRDAVAATHSPWLQLVEQTRVASAQALQARLREVVAAGGEGLMLHRDSAPYRAERSDDLLKLKAHDDAEANVIGYVPGKGKYAGMVGALRVRDAQGREFRIGGGLSDAQRRDPPPVGARVTYLYDGLTRKGLPRFPRFLRVRDDEPKGAP